MALDDETWHTIDEVADHLRMSKATVQRLVADGAIESRKFSPRMRRISASAIRDFIESKPLKQRNTS